MPGLLRMMGRTAAVAGTATVVSNRVSRRQYNRWGEQDAVADQGAAAYSAPAAAAPPPPGDGGGNDQVAQLQQLAALKDQGALTDEEFAAAKARILGG